MAFFLKRSFRDSPNVHVFHDLCIEHKGEHAQFDHLVLHRAGIIVVESKSVTSSVRVNERGEWSRLWDDKWIGMASPIQQAQVQLELLWSVLDTANTELLGRMLGVVQRGFGGYKYDVFAAISTNGIVERAVPADYPTVCKADQVCDKVWALICKHRALASLGGKVNTAYNPRNWGKWAERAVSEFTENEFAKVSDFLLRLHKERPAPVAADATARVPSDAPVTSSVLIVPGNLPPNPTKESTATCADCSARLTVAVQEFCRSNSRRFGGGAYCMGCQKKY